MLNTYYIGVKAIIIDKSSRRILLLEKNAGNDNAIFFDLPGGRIEGNETLTQALSRELQEEIGYTINSSEINKKPIGMAQITNNLLNADAGLCLTYIPLVVDKEFELSLSSEHQAGSWYTEGALDTLLLKHPNALQESVPYIKEVFDSI